MKTILSRDFRPFLYIIHYTTCVTVGCCAILLDRFLSAWQHTWCGIVKCLNDFFLIFLYVYFLQVFEIGLSRCFEINKRRILLSFYEDLLDLRAIISAHGNSWYVHRCRFSIKREPTVLCWSMIHVRLLYLNFLCPLRKITNPRIGKERRFWFKLECNDMPL